MIILIVIFPLLILSFEGMKGHFFSPITTVYIAFASYILGYITIVAPTWDYFFTDI
jgi:Cu/Ag efflux pump CusA